MSMRLWVGHTGGFYMGSLYRRIVTMGMISFTAFLAWIYCIINYKSEPIYIGIVSVVLVVSIYALLNGIIGLNASKEKKIQNYISETVANAVVGISNQDNDNTDMERLAKASYVQLRKANTAINQFAETTNKNAQQNIDSYNEINISTKKMVTDSVNKAVKVMVKYDQNNNAKLVSTINELNKALSDMNREMTSIKQAVLDMEINVPVNFNSESPNTGAKSLDMFDDADDDDGMIKYSSSGSAMPDFSTEDSVMMDSVASDYSAEDISAMFEASKEERRAKTQDDFQVFDHPEAMEQDLIDGLLASAERTVESIPETKQEEPSTADVIPFPAVAEQEETIAQPEPDFDPNKQLSPDEIAALFASVGNLAGGSEVEPEPVVEPEPESAPVAPAMPVDEDPNRQLSPDEIAALFASMQ